MKIEDEIAKINRNRPYMERITLRRDIRLFFRRLWNRLFKEVN